MFSKQDLKKALKPYFKKNNTNFKNLHSSLYINYDKFQKVDYKEEKKINDIFDILKNK